MKITSRLQLSFRVLAKSIAANIFTVITLKYFRVFHLKTFISTNIWYKSSRSQSQSYVMLRKLMLCMMSIYGKLYNIVP